MKMRKFSFELLAFVIAGTFAAACSNSDESEKPAGIGETPFDGGGGRSDGGGDASKDGGAEEDADIEDGGGDLVPNDADRGERDGSDAEPGDGGEDGEVLPEPECIFDRDCEETLAIGVCELPKCTAGKCSTTLAPRAYPCDDGIECSSGGLCEEGVCTPGRPDVTNPDCVDEVSKGALWFTEIMGRPQAIDDSVDANEGQWIEIVSRASKEVHLQGMRIVHYDWAPGGEEPIEPVYSAFYLSDASVSPRDPLLITRSSDPALNGGLRGAFAYGDAFELKADRNTRLILVSADWTKDAELPLGELPTGPIDAKYIIDSVRIPAGTFGDVNRGRSWQASAPLPDSSDARVWCHTPADSANAYVEEGALRNYGTPGQTNQSCPP